MISFSLLFVSGVWFLQQQATLPDMQTAWWLFSILPALWIPLHTRWQRISRSFLLLLLAFYSGFFYAAWIAQNRLADELPSAWQGRDISLTGVVATIPRQHDHGLSFIFDVEQVNTLEAHVPKRIMLSTYIDKQHEPLVLHAGERWQLTVRLKQPHGSSNPFNFDFEAWSLELNLRALGYVNSKGDNHRIDDHVFSPGYGIERIREGVRAHFRQVLGDAPYIGVLSALAIGDQDSITSAQWQVFTRTGVNHLMSISGLHITMLAGLAYAFCYWIWRRSARLTLFIPARKVASLVGFLAALVYALLAGYGVPAQRTVYMLATVAIALWSSRNIAPSQLLAIALLVVTLFDPWSVISPGFWLSYGAVALIFYITSNRLGIRGWLIEYVRVQWAMSIGLIPLLLALFQQISLVSPLANAFAIPLVSFVVVPLTLLGALLPFDWLLQLAHLSMSGCMFALEWLNTMPDAVWTQHAPPVWCICVGMFGILWMLLPSGFPARWLGALIILPMFLISPETPPYGAIRMMVFDVGQGLAVSVQTRNHALLFDSGPDFNGEADSGNRILVPALRGMGIAQLDGLILSHNDLDHTGGAVSVLQAIPVSWVSSSLETDNEILEPVHDIRRCEDGQSWDWDGVHFEILHPSRVSYRQEDVSTNNRGCVLSISSGSQTVLLTADIEKDTENRLLKLHPEKLPATLMVVPHHGSKTSSTQEFVQKVRPRYAIFTMGYRNRFHHPRPEVVARYSDIGSELFRSDEDGAIIIQMNAADLTLERYRKTHARYWYQNHGEKEVSSFAAADN